MRIFVTGATGFLGYHFVNVAVALGHEVLCLRRSTSKSLFEPIIEEKVTWVNNDSTFKDIVCQFKPEVLFHAAWGGVRGAGRDDVNTQKANIEMSDYFYSLYPYKQIISIGSQAEYGYYQGPVLETHSLKPEMEYAKAKVISCNHLKEYCEKHNIEWQWIRIFTVFGEKQTGGLVKGFTTNVLMAQLSLIQQKVDKSILICIHLISQKQYAKYWVQKANLVFIIYLNLIVAIVI